MSVIQGILATGRNSHFRSRNYRSHLSRLDLLRLTILKGMPKTLQSRLVIILLTMKSELKNFKELNADEQMGLVAGSGQNVENCGCGEECSCFCKEKDGNGSTTAAEQGTKVKMSKKQFMG